MRDHRKLRVFDLADAFALEVYRATRSFPNDERYGLTSQMRRAAVSIAANIVEGCGRRTERDFLHFLDIALGSLREVGYLVSLAARLEYLDAIAAQALESQYEEAARALGALIQSLRRSST